MGGTTILWLKVQMEGVLRKLLVSRDHAQDQTCHDGYENMVNDRDAKENLV